MPYFFVEKLKTVIKKTQTMHICSQICNDLWKIHYVLTPRAKHR